MDKPAATLATFADFKIIKTRKLVQLVMELPIERADEALAALGGLPRSDGERWVGIALVEKPPTTEAPTKPKQHFSQLPRSQQAGILCADPEFQKYVLGLIRFVQIQPDDRANQTAAVVRGRCHIETRAALDDYKRNQDAASRWDILVTAYRAETGQMAEERG